MTRCEVSHGLRSLHSRLIYFALMVTDQSLCAAARDALRGELAAQLLRTRPFFTAVHALRFVHLAYGVSAFCTCWCLLQGAHHPLLSTPNTPLRPTFVISSTTTRAPAAACVPVIQCCHSPPPGMAHIERLSHKLEALALG